MKQKIFVIFAVVASWCWSVAGLVPAHATTPGTNGRITFQMDFGRGPEIYSIKQSGLGVQQLTEVPGSAESPDFSPGGTEIAFQTEDPSGVWIMDADGSHLHQVAASGAQPAFTPDGSHLVYGCGECAGGQGSS